MESADLLNDFASLPPEAQRQVTDFIAFLKERYKPPRPLKSRRSALNDEPFVGMWRGREDMVDSTAWVRELRRAEWNRG